MWDHLKETDEKAYEILELERNRQEEGLELIASENFVSPSVMEAAGSLLTNKYAEGYPNKRYYGGCKIVDMAESLARNRAKDLFNAKYVNVQPHSGSQANMTVYFAFLKPGDKIMGMSLSEGGHLTHGSPVNFSGLLYDVASYGVDENTGYIDMDNVEKLAEDNRPKLIIAGGSAYGRIIDFKKFREIADKINALLMVDMAHFAGLVAAGLYPNPVDYAHVVTTTTHKTLRGTRGGMVLTNDKDVYKKINKALFPGIQGGPLMHVILAKAVSFGEALKDDFKFYQQKIVINAKALAAELEKRGNKIVSGGTDTHVFLLDLSNTEITGKAAEKALERVDITVNKNTVPGEKRSPFITSGIRIGTPAVTTRGMDETNMSEIADLIDYALKNIKDEEGMLEDNIIKEIKDKVHKLTERYPLYKKL